MSHSISLRDYRSALTTPGAGWPVFTSLLGRLPIAMIGISLLLYVERETNSFGFAGVVSAGVLGGVAFGSVVQGRVMDRVGPTVPLIVMSGWFGAMVALAVLAIEAHAPLPVLVVLAFAVGISQPSVGPASRALWPKLVPAGPAREAALSYEAISMEAFFILGPGISGLLVAMPWGGTGFVVGSTCMMVGSLGFAVTSAARRQRPNDAPRGSMLGALSTPGMRTVAIAALAFGVLMGFIEVAVPASADRAGHPTVGGLLLSVLSLSSVVVGVLYGMRPWPRPMHLRLPALVLCFSVLIAALAVPTTLYGLTLALLAAGSLVTPQATAHSVSLELAAPEGTATEAFGWVVTSVTLGAAFGQSASGQLVEASGPPLAFVVAGGLGVLLAGVLWARRATLRTASEPQRSVVARP